MSYQHGWYVSLLYESTVSEHVTLDKEMFDKMQLIPGHNTAISGAPFELKLSTKHVPAGYAVDYSCFALTSQGKVRGDSDFIFFNNSSQPGISLDVKAACFRIEPQALPTVIEKLCFCITIQSGVYRKQNVSLLGAVSCKSRELDLEFTMLTDGREEVALVLAELYRRNGQWKFRALGQGFNGGLGPLAQSYGIEIAEDESNAPAQSQNSKPTQSSNSINQSKITLEKTGDTISLEKTEQPLGEVVINLQWEANVKTDSDSGGFLGSLLKFGDQGAIDLDLGCLFEFHDGYRGVIQALGRAFGQLDQPPYIMLDGDDRTGASVSGETIRINGHHWEKMKRVLVFAYIYEGTPAWDKANAVVTLKAPNQPEIQVKLDNPARGEFMCAIAMLENNNGSLQVRKEVRYIKGDQMHLDRAYNWGMRWKQGSK